MAVTLLPACDWTEGAFAIYTANVHTHKGSAERRDLQQRNMKLKTP